MGGLFKKPKAPAPDPKIEENLREQEVQAEKAEIQEQKRISAQFKNRIKGGRRLLMAQGVTPGQRGRDTTPAQEELASTLGRNPTKLS